MKHHWLTATFVYLAFASIAQPCDCPVQFQFLSNKLAINYSGYRDKVNTKTQAAFDAHTAQYRSLTASVDSDTACARLLHEWTLFFKDHHVQMSFNAKQEDPETIRQRYTDWERIEVSEKAVKANALRPDADPVEGIWEMQGGNYRVAIIPAPSPVRDFAAVVLRADSVWWVPGQVKFDLKKTKNGYSPDSTCVTTA